MQPIKQSIYGRPEIRHGIKPLWPAWATTGVGALCGLLYYIFPNMPSGAGTLLLFVAGIGAFSLVLTLLFYLFGDSRFPYHKERHCLLEPTLTYYAKGSQQQLTTALETGDEKSLAAVKRTSQPELVLMRYSDMKETIYYSQLLRPEGKKLVALTDIYVNTIQ